MKKWKKYVKGILAAVLTILAIVLAVFLGVRLLRFFMPFVIGWLIAMIASPLVRMVEKRMKIARKHTSMLIVIAVLAAIIGAGYFLGAKTAEQVGQIIEQAPDIYGGFREDFQEVEHNLDRFITQLPANVQDSINNVQNSLGEQVGKLVGNLSEWTVGYAGDMAKHLPSVLISIIFTILSAYFFIADRDVILEMGRKNTPQLIQTKWKLLADSFKKVFGGYFKAQFKIMAIIWVILCVGLLFLKVRFAVLVAFLISFLDMLPFFGTGTALIPWALFKLLSGDARFAVGLAILYLVTQLVRRIIEPKMVGDSIGMNPLLTLVFMYTGYRISSVIGMILAVPIGAVVINFYKVGVFDGPIRCVKEALEDFLEWLHKNSGGNEQTENKE